MFVSIHAPARGATTITSRPLRVSRRFNPRAREGRDRGQAGSNRRRLGVSIHAPARGATRASGYWFQGHFVSIHAPARGATICRYPWHRQYLCFNPRAREGRDWHLDRRRQAHRRFNPRAREGRDLECPGQPWQLSRFQSTRPRGARHRLAASPCTDLGFNPRAREGRDARQVRTRPGLFCFNPRAREGRDGRPRRTLQPRQRVSIHAPARGATVRVRHVRAGREVSIHAPARGATRQGYVEQIVKAFQSTRPRGARPSGQVPVSGPFCFNPRAREGRDDVLRFKCGSPIVSIHAPARGATRGRTMRLVRPVVSIHAPARGATLGDLHVIYLLPVSIHAPARGATPAKRDARPSRSVSIHAPARGATPCATPAQRQRHCFNPRAREGRDRTYCANAASSDRFQSTRPRGARRETPTNRP